MTAAEVPIERETLRWAMWRVGLKEEDLAHALRVSPERVRAWLEGKELPTYPQALKLAKKLYIGLPQLLLPPPEVQLPTADFRRGPSRGQEPSPELLEALYDAQRKQAWLKERRKKRLPFVGTGVGKEPSTVGQEIREALGLEGVQFKAIAPEGFLKEMGKRAEDQGILVLRQGHVGTNTRRTYSPEEFSGFSLVDPVVPVVFVNAQDPPPRQVFTLAHELAHVWLGEGGLEGSMEEEPQEGVERLADRVAAEVLMPEEVFRAAWRENLPPLEAAGEVARRFKVSRMAALKRAQSLGLLPWLEYEEALQGLRQTKERRSHSKGGDFWRTFWVQNSPTFVEEVRRAFYEGEADLKEVATLLNLSLPTAMVFLSKKPPEGRV